MLLPCSVPAAFSSRALPVTVASTIAAPFSGWPIDLADPFERRALEVRRQVGRAGVVERDVALAGDLQIGTGDRQLRQVPFAVRIGAVDDGGVDRQIRESWNWPRLTRPVASKESTVTPDSVVANRRIHVDRAGQIPGDSLVAGHDRRIEAGELSERLHVQVAAARCSS